MISGPFVNTLGENIKTLAAKVLEILEKYQDSEFSIENISISIFIPNKDAMRSSNRSIAQATHKWLTISPKSKTNCLFQSLAVCKGFHRNINLPMISSK